MDSMTFLTEAKKRGVTKEQAMQKMQAYREQFGAFEDDAAPPAAPEQPGITDKIPYGESLSRFATKDIPGAITGLDKRMTQREDAVRAPTAMAEDLGLKPGLAADIVGAPERAVRIGGAAAGDVMDVIGTGVGIAGKAVNRLTGSNFGRYAASKVLPKIEPYVKPVVARYEAYKAAQPQSAQANLTASEGYASALGMKLPGAPGALAKGAGEALEKGGVRSIIKDMKPKDVTAKLAGRDVNEGAKKLASDIAKYKVESPMGGFTGTIKKIDSKLDANYSSVEKAVASNYAKTGATIDIDNTFIKYLDDLKAGKIEDVFGDEEQAAKYAGDIHKALELRGLAGPQPIAKLSDIKRTINKYAGGLFPKGTQALNKDPLKLKTGELAYLRVRDDLEQAVPEIRKYNQESHDLLNVRKAASEAVKRIGNRNDISLVDAGLLVGGPTAAHSLGITGMAAGVLPGAAIIGSKIAGSGRGASAMIGAGRALQDAATRPINLNVARRAAKISEDLGQGGYAGPSPLPADPVVPPVPEPAPVPEPTYGPYNLLTKADVNKNRGRYGLLLAPDRPPLEKLPDPYGRPVTVEEAGANIAKHGTGPTDVPTAGGEGVGIPDKTITPEEIRHNTQKMVALKEGKEYNKSNGGPDNEADNSAPTVRNGGSGKDGGSVSGGSTERSGEQAPVGKDTERGKGENVASPKKRKPSAYKRRRR